MEAEKSKTKAQSDWVPCENSLPTLQMAASLLCPHMAEKRRVSSNPITELPLMNSSKANYFPKAPTSKYHCIRD